MKLPFKRPMAGEAPDMSDMTLLGHLTELRKRLIRSVMAIVVGATLVLILKNQVLQIIEDPYCEFQLSTTDVESCTFLNTDPLEALSVVISVAGYGGLLLALPVILYQFGRFVMPGLYPREKRLLIPFVLISIVLMAFGVISAYILMPRSLTVLQGFGSDTFTPLYTPSRYISFFVKMMLAFGLAAEFPLILVFLQMVGLVKPDKLASNRRIAIVAVAVLAAVITPTGDPFNLAIVSIPMYLSYEVSIVIGRLMLRRRGTGEATGPGLAG